MTLIAVQVDPCIRNVFREPLSVREGHHPILLALPHRHRWLDLREVESQSRTNARSSSRQPAMPFETACRKVAARKSAKTPVSAPLSTSDTRLPRAAPNLRPLDFARLLEK